MGKDDAKLVRMLSMLDAEAWAQFRIFLNSPWFNRSNTIRELAERIQGELLKQAEPLSDEALYDSLYPGEHFDPIKLKNIRAGLQRKFDDFLGQLALARNEELQSRLLLQQLNFLNEGRYFPKYHQRAIERISKQCNTEEQRQLSFFGAAEEWDAAQPRFVERSSSDANGSAYSHAWQFFQLQTIKFLVRQANRGAMLDQSVDTAQAESILNQISAGPEALPTIQLYKCLLDVFRNPHDAGMFQLFRQRLQALGRDLPKIDASDIYAGAINHCIRSVNRGEAAFANTMLELYQEMDGLDLLLQAGKMPGPQLKNMVTLAMGFSAFDWAQSLIDRYSDLIDQDPHSNAIAFNQGMIYFMQGKFDAAERCFNQVLQAFDDVFYGLDARNFLLRIHYENGNWTGLESLSESFRLYLKRNKRISKQRQASYLFAIRFLIKLAKIPTWNASALHKLKADIEQAAFSAMSKDWLLLKVQKRLSEVKAK